MRHSTSSSKILASFLAVLVAATGSLAAAPDVNFWAARQRARGASPAPVAPVLPQDIQPPAPSNQTPEAWVRRILPVHASVRDVVRPTGKPSGEVVILAQDVHVNAEAQTNLSALLRHLASTNSSLLLALEGAFAPLPLDRAQSFGDQPALRVAADYLLRENRISGAVHGALVSGLCSVRAVGVDDEKLYWRHVGAYRAGIPVRAEFDRKLESAGASLVARRRALSSALQTRVTLGDKHSAGLISLPVYVARLLDLRSGADRGRLPAGLPELAKLLDAHRLESSLDFARAEAEWTALLRELSATIRPDDVRRLIDLAAAYKLGRLSHREFFTSLAETLEANGIEMSRAPLFKSYLRYMALVDALNPERMFAERTRLEDTLLAETGVSADERAVLDLAERLSLLRRLRDQALTPDDWRRYLDLTSVGSHLSLPDASLVAPFEAFYRLAEERDAALARNLLARMRAEKSRSAVVVAGGFHARGLIQRLTTAGATVISVVPNLSKVDPSTGTAYLTYFAREKTPLDRIFEGRRLFLPTPPAQLGALGALTALAQEAADPDRRLADPGATVSRLDGTPASGVSSEDLSDGQASVTAPAGRFVGRLGLSSVAVTPSARAALRPLSIVHPLAVVLYQRAMIRASNSRPGQVAIMAAFVGYMVIAGPLGETALLSFLTSSLGSGMVAGVLFVVAHLVAAYGTRIVVRRLYADRAVVPISGVSDLRSPAAVSLFLLGAAVVSAPFLMGATPAAFQASLAVHTLLNAAYIYMARILVGDAVKQEPLTGPEEIAAGLSVARLAARLIEDLQEQTGKDMDHSKRGLVGILMDLQARARAPYESWVRASLRKHEAVRVLQWNMLEKPEASRWQLQKGQFERLLKRGRPHVVTLQEVTPGDEGSTAVELARAHGYAIHEWEPRPGLDRGLPAMAVLYDPSFDLVEAWDVKVSGAGVLLGVTLRSRETGKVIHVGTCRLSFHPTNDREIRAYQRETISEEMSRRGRPGDAIIVTGDFNPASEQEIKEGMRQFPGYVDTFRETNTLAAGVTFSMANSFTKNYSRGPTASLPSSKRLDLILAGAATGEPLAALDATLEFNERPFSSDHFALMSDIGLGVAVPAVPEIDTISAGSLAEMRRLVAAGVLSPGDAVLLFEAWAASLDWTAAQVEAAIPEYFPLLAPRLGVDDERWSGYAAPARREPFETSVWYDNMRAPMDKRLRNR